MTPWGVHMRPLYPNLAEPRFYPPHVPTKDTGTREWAESKAKELADKDSAGGGPWPAWAFEAREYPDTCGPVVADEAHPLRPREG